MCSMWAEAQGGLNNYCCILRKYCLNVVVYGTFPASPAPILASFSHNLFLPILPPLLLKGARPGFRPFSAVFGLVLGASAGFSLGGVSRRGTRNAVLLGPSMITACQAFATAGAAATGGERSTRFDSRHRFFVFPPQKLPRCPEFLVGFLTHHLNCLPI